MKLLLCAILAPMLVLILALTFNWVIQVLTLSAMYSYTVEGRVIGALLRRRRDGSVVLWVLLTTALWLSWILYWAKVGGLLGWWLSLMTAVVLILHRAHTTTKLHALIEKLAERKHSDD